MATAILIKKKMHSINFAYFYLPLVSCVTIGLDFC